MDPTGNNNNPNNLPKLPSTEQEGQGGGNISQSGHGNQNGNQAQDFGFPHTNPHSNAFHPGYNGHQYNGHLNAQRFGYPPPDYYGGHPFNNFHLPQPPPPPLLSSSPEAPNTWPQPNSNHELPPAGSIGRSILSGPPPSHLPGVPFHSQPPTPPSVGASAAMELTAVAQPKPAKKRGHPVGSGKAKDKSKANDAPKTHGGRAVGSINFGAEEMAMLVNLVEEHLPIGSHGWDEVHKEYESWRKEEGFREQDIRSLKQKFDKIVDLAMKKPTGEANCSDLLTAALRTNDALTSKSHSAMLQDDFDSDDDGRKNHGDSNIIEISDDDDPCPSTSTKAGSGAPSGNHDNAFKHFMQLAS